MFLSGGKSLLAIDLGSYSIKVMELQHTSSGYELLNMGMAPIEPDVVVDGEIENQEAVIAALGNLLKSEKIKTKRAVMSVSGQSVIIKKLSVPKMADDELAEMIREEAEQYIPFDLEEVNLDFEVLTPEKTGSEEQEDEKSEDDDEQVDVIIVAARKETIQGYKDVGKALGISIKVMDLDVFALQNAYEHAYGLQEGCSVALINIGATMSNINIVENGLTAFTRDLQMGGSTISEEVQKALSIGFTDAEKLKLGGTVSGVDDQSEVNTRIMDGVDYLIHEIKKSIELFEKTADYKVSKVYLAGGASQMADIDKIFEEKSGIPTELLRTFGHLKYSGARFDQEYADVMEPVMAIPLGLALRKVDDK